MGSQRGRVARSGLAVLGDDLYGVDVEPVLERLVRFNAEELVGGLPHHLHVQTRSDILVGIGIAHEHEVDTLARRGRLNRNHLPVLGVVGGLVAVISLHRAEDALQGGNQRGRSRVSKPVPERIGNIGFAGGDGIAVLVHQGGRRSAGAPDRPFRCREVPNVEIIPLVITPLLEDIFEGTTFIGGVVGGVEGGNDLQAVFVVFLIHPLQDRHDFFGERTPGGPIQQDGNLVLGTNLLVGNRLSGDDVLQPPLRPEGGDVIVSHHDGGLSPAGQLEIHIDQIGRICGREERVGNPFVQVRFVFDLQSGAQTGPGIRDRPGEGVAPKLHLHGRRIAAGKGCGKRTGHLLVTVKRNEGERDILEEIRQTCHRRGVQDHPLQVLQFSETGGQRPGDSRFILNQEPGERGQFVKAVRELSLEADTAERQFEFFL